MKNPLLILLAVVALAWTALAPATGAPFTAADLGPIHRLRQQRQFAEARSRYATIARNAATPRPLRQEAGYWMGFCSVMDQSFPRAIHDFRWYLEAFPGEDNRFLPDALYVLARTYEVEGQPAAAAWYYRQCLRSPAAAKTAFPAKARAGLERVEGMLGVESYKPRLTLLPGERVASPTGDLVDPFSRKPLKPDQSQRVKTFIQRLSAQPLDRVLPLLQPEDRTLALVTRTIELHRQHQASQAAPGASPRPKP